MLARINYANRKLHNPPLNKIMKVLVGYIKPVARMVALYWLKRNLPDLLTAWLESKVSFEDVVINDEEAVTGDLETVPITKAEAEMYAPKKSISTVPNMDDFG